MLVKKIFLLICIIYIFFTNTIYATDTIIESQLNELDLSAFIKAGENYTKEIFPDINVDELLKSAIKGEVDNKSLMSGIFKMLGQEVSSAIGLVRQYINNSYYT